MYSLMLTFGLSLALEGILTELFETVSRSIAFRPETIEFLNVSTSQNKIIGGLIGWIAVIGIAVFLRRAELGQAIRATSQAPDLAEACGINAPRIRAITFGIGSALAGVAGVAYILSFSVSPIIGRFLVLLAFVMVILGGLNSIFGAGVAGLLLALFLSFSQFYVTQQGTFAVVFLGITVLLLIRPYGLFGEPEETHG